MLRVGLWKGPGGFKLKKDNSQNKKKGREGEKGEKRRVGQ